MKFIIDKPVQLIIDSAIRQYNAGEYETSDKDEIKKLDGCMSANRVASKSKREEGAL